MSSLTSEEEFQGAFVQTGGASVRDYARVAANLVAVSCCTYYWALLWFLVTAIIFLFPGAGRQTIIVFFFFLVVLAGRALMKRVPDDCR